jgi:hypothetical protein
LQRNLRDGLFEDKIGRFVNSKGYLVDEDFNIID